jgi:hypothetical protein
MSPLRRCAEDLEARGRPGARQLIFKCAACGHVELVLDTPKPASTERLD